MTESTITAKGQTTLPKSVRAALGLQPGDKLRYLIREDGEVRIVAVRRVSELAGMLHRADRAPVCLEDMDAVIAEGASRK